MTRRAAVYLLVLFSLLTVALSTGAQIYYLLVIAMAALFAGSLAAAGVALGTLGVRMKSVRKTVERGASVPLSATVKYVSVLPVKRILVKLSVPGDMGELDEIELDAALFGAREYDMTLPCPHRGVYPIGVKQVSVTDVFGLITLRRGVGESRFQVEVLPRVRPAQPIRVQSGDMGDSRFTRMTEDNASPADVRGWREGDPLKKVHWKLSMRKRELMVRTYEESARPDTLILVDLFPPGALRAHAMTVEDAVCEAALGVASAQLNRGYPVRMPLLNKHPSEVEGESGEAVGRFQSALMRVAFDSAYPFEQVIALEMRRMQRTGGTVLVTHRLSARVADMAMSLQRTGVAVTVIWVTDNRRDEALEMLSRLSLAGADARRIDPWE